MKSLTDEQATEMLATLSKHYKEPVRPVSEYCNAFREWHKACKQRLDEPFTGDWERNNWEEIVKALDRVYIPIVKSNYLWRLIYGDQQVRTEKCPKHKGRWSGYALGIPMTDDEVRAAGKEVTPYIRYHHNVCECQHGYDITGWLPK